jgi:hypothetical protein
MIKLNLTKEQAEKSYRLSAAYGYDYELAQDWLALHAELARLNKAIREAVGEINSNLGHIQKTTYENKPIRFGISDGIEMSVNILRKHFPELKEDNNE